MKKLLFSIAFGFLLFLSCNENPKPSSEKLSTEEAEIFIKKGKSIALSTFLTLSTELGTALQEGGVSKAVEVCNISAFSLVDSLSKVNNATIRRTSLKVRNPKNNPSSKELAVLNNYRNALQNGEKLEPKIEKVNGMVSFYAPIIAQPLCLNCHGKVGETLKEEDYDFIKTLYPKDQAIGYETGDLRGIWSIEFEN